MNQHSHPEATAMSANAGAATAPDRRPVYPQAAALNAFADAIQGTTYNGWTLYTYQDRDGDGFPRYQRSAVYMDGKRVFIDFTDFEPLAPETFCKLVDLGLPRRADLGMSSPLRTEHIDAAHADRMRHAVRTVGLGVAIFLSAAWLLAAFPMGAGL